MLLWVECPDYILNLLYDICHNSSYGPYMIRESFTVDSHDKGPDCPYNFFSHLCFAGSMKYRSRVVYTLLRSRYLRRDFFRLGVN